MFLKNFHISRDEQSRIHFPSNSISSRQNELRSGRLGLSLVLGDLYQRYAREVGARRSASELPDGFSVLDNTTNQEVVQAPGGFLDGLAELLNIPLNEEDSAYYQENSNQGGSHEQDYYSQSYGSSSNYSSGYAPQPISHGYDSSVYSSQPVSYRYGSSVYSQQPVSYGYGGSAHSHSCSVHSHQQFGLGQYSRTVGSRTVNLLRGAPESGCTLVCIAMVANRSYLEVRRLASQIAGFDGSRGVGFDHASQILTRLGVQNTIRPNHGQLNVRDSDFPDLAIVSVNDALSPTGFHAVVALYTSDGVTIFDGNHPHPRVPSDYSFASNYSYIEIHH